MNRLFSFGPSAAVLLSAWLLSAESRGQNLALQRPQPFNDLTGKIVSVRPGMIEWSDDSKEPHFAALSNETKVQVVGAATPEVVTSGTYVRFEVEMTKRLKPTTDIQELTIFSPADGYSVGIVDDGSAGADAKTSKCLVSGEVRSLKNGMLIVDVGEKPIKVKLAEDAEIKVDFSDYTVAKEGDEITVSGVGQTKDQLHARKIEIRLAAPLAPPETKKKARSGSAAAKSRKKPSKKPADTDDSGGPSSLN